MTGLNCKDFPTKEALNKLIRPGKQLWKIITTDRKRMTGEKLINLIKSTKQKDHKFALTLAWFVHCILLARDRSCGIGKVILKLACNKDDFYKYPWGRRCFGLTLEYLSIDMKIRQRFGSYNLYGFPWAFIVTIISVFIFFVSFL